MYLILYFIYSFIYLHIFRLMRPLSEDSIDKQKYFVVVGLYVYL